ncbi:hypothetical protein SASPL_126268 [Salvia splendens]|uniref:Uncharacterized protein n=1 Tax=Salvia splendens TaxID=180675 RepID=A0A8X8XIK5_SALSN|nr:hypothetical protein SASPL_126268 [Salvia splendens]
MKDQTGNFYYSPSLAFRKAAGGFGAIRILIAMTELPSSRKWQVLQSVLDSGKMLTFPDGVLINGNGGNNTQFTVEQGTI